MARAGFISRAITRGALLLFAAVAVGDAAAQSPSDADIRRQMIRESIGRYSGPCPCPYNIMRNGKPCGRFSAWSKPGGQAPLCFDKDITDAMVGDYRRQTNQTR